ncbi:MAG: hypothetical protein K2H22_09830 [Muribaculaceae bacterium]|nr:hypothetical protein [Muribaculaceae bacterium]
MITIPDKSFKSSIKLADILYVMKKDEMLRIAKRLDFYVSPNVNKDKTATRLAKNILEEPIEIVSRLSKTELLLLEELLNTGPDTYVEKKLRKSPYMLQKWGLVVTYEDEANGKQYLLMPDEVREVLARVSTVYIAMAKEGKKGPSAKELRMASMMADLLGHTDFTIIDGMVINHRAISDDQ